MMPTPAVFIGLGSNLGDREDALARSLVALERRGFEIEARSSLYLTEPVDAPGATWFLNAVVGGSWPLEPEDLLESCLAIEAELGRVRTTRHAPRTLDLDLLLFGDLVRDTGRLRLPHPRLSERLFVLVPLAEIAPERRHPLLGLRMRELRDRCSDSSRVLLHAPFAPAPGGA